MLEKKPALKVKVAGILGLFERYGILLILGLRFAYGFRTMIPTVMGMSPISTKKFIFWDCIGGVIWSCFFVLGGYFLGHAFDKISKWLELRGSHAFIAVMIVVVALGFVYAIYKLVQRYYKSRQ